jgi:hypothetical protein
MFARPSDLVRAAIGVLYAAWLPPINMEGLSSVPPVDDVLEIDRKVMVMPSETVCTGEYII